MVVFPEKRTVEMGQTICQLHGGHLAVPTNAVENEVRQILSCNDRFHFIIKPYKNQRLNSMLLF